MKFLQLLILICFVCLFLGCGGGDGGSSPENQDNIITGSANNIPLLLISISFNDYQIQDSELNWHNKIFGGSNNQVNHYYNEVSSGKFSLAAANESSGTINDGIIQVSLPINHPGNADMNTTHLRNAVDIADGFIDFSAYDVNANNNIERDELQIMFIVAGGEAAYGDPLDRSIWAHTSGLSTPHLVDGVNIMHGASNGTYSSFGEKHGNHFATIGVIVHELGHAIWWLPDLYDTDATSKGIGYFGLMGAGSWGAKSSEYHGQTPTHMCAWSKLELNWINPQVHDLSTNNIEVHASHSSSYNTIKVPTNDPQEYFLIENRSPLGYDAGLFRLDNISFSGGLAIWHIDEGQREIDNTDNVDETHKLVDLEEANDPVLDNNINEGQGTNLYYAGNSTLFDDSSVPNSKKYDGSTTNISVNNISSVGSVADEYIMYIDISK